MKPITRKDLVDYMERVMSTETAEQIVIEYQVLGFIERTQLPPDVRGPEGCRLRDGVPSPGLKNA